MDEVKELMGLVFSAGGMLGWIKGKLTSLEEDIKDIQKRMKELNESNKV